MVKKAKQLDSAVQSFCDKCRQKGLKVTPQRIAVYNALIKSKDHPSAEMLHKKVTNTHPSISLDTVNRTLATINGMNLAFTVEGTGQPKRYDGNLQQHNHFRCIKCNKILDLSHIAFENINILNYIGGKIKVLRKTVYFEGLCQNCQK